jgi:hypothetical protein
MTPVRPPRRIGLIVAGSLGTGLTAAIGLALGLVAVGSEDMVSGCVLLAFALGWVSLAVLSARWTDQPQRWAIAPAAVMALCAGLLIFTPDTSMLDALGWVWPLGLIALVVWMIIHSRRQLRSRTRPLLLYSVFAVLALSALGGGRETIREWQDRGAYAMFLNTS